MSRQKIIVQDRVGHHYRLQLRHSPPLGVTVKAERFSDESSARQFVSKLRISDERWPQILRQANGAPANRQLSAPEYHRAIAGLMASGTIKVYKLDHLNGAGRQAAYPAITTQQSEQYRFVPVSAVLAGEVRETQSFQQGGQQAQDFIAQLDLNDAQLTSILASLGLPASAGSAALAQAMVEGKVVVARAPVPQVKTDGADSESAADTASGETSAKSATLGPHEAGGAAAAAASLDAAEKEDAPPLCQRNSLTVSCGHGHSVTLDPGTKHMPSLDVVASAKAKNKPDTITITSDITDICPGHTVEHIKIGGEAIEISHTEAGKTGTIKAFAETLDIRLNPIKYAWLPRIKPKTYPIYPGTTCDGRKLKDAGKGILLNVYPDVAWDWSVALGYGKDSVSIESSETDKNAYQTALKRKRFSIDGKVKLIQDGKSIEFDNQFKKAVDSTSQQINRITGLVENVVGRFDEGEKPKVDVTWPNLKLNLKTALAEGNDHHRNVTFDFGISAAPFFGLKCSVDILPIIAAPLGGGFVGKKLIEEAMARVKEGVGSEEGIASLKGTVSIVMSGSGSLNCDAHFKGDFSDDNNRIDKVSGTPVETKIEFSAEGKVDIRGHLFTVKVELVAGIGIKSGITLDLQIDSDDTGYYWQPNAKFNGVKVYITKYVKTEENSGENDSSGRFGGGGSKKTIKEVSDHVWIDEKKLDTQKHYFIEY